MPRSNATMLGSDTPNARRMTRAKMDEFNPSGILLNNAFLNRKPAYYVYLYNAGDLPRRIERPWAHPAVLLSPCEPGEAYSKPFIIPDIVAEAIPQAGRTGLAVNGVDGKFLAQDALFPDNPFGSWEDYQPTPAGMAQNIGTDLYARGCWWSLDPSPEVDSEEVLTARNRITRHYEHLVQQATEFSMQGLEGMKQITGEMHHAADFFKLKTSWHQHFTAQIECPGCSQTIPLGTMRHMPKTVCGFVLNWPGAVRGGMATREEARDAGIILTDSTTPDADEVPAKAKRAKK
jgi:hypothetical protein